MPACSTQSDPCTYSRSFWLYGLTLASFVFLCIPSITDAFAFHWMYVGLGMGWLITLGYVHRRAQQRPNHAPITTLHWLIFAAYCVHQFEEHGYDIFGQAYAFMPSINAVMQPHLHCPPGIACPLDPALILYVNTVLVWLPFLLAMWGGERARFAGLAAVGIPLVNGWVHIASAVIHQAYNPGLLTSIVLFVPMCIVYFRTLAAQGRFLRRDLAFSVVYGLMGHVLLMGLAVATNAYNAIPQWSYPVLLGIYAVLPACLDYQRQCHRSHGAIIL